MIRLALAALVLFASPAYAQDAATLPGGASALSEMHGGSMQIASELGRGTTVSVRIPLDGTTRIAEHQTSSDKIVALTDARKKSPTPAQDNRQTRRSA